MKVVYGKSGTGNVEEAVRGISGPKLLIMTSGGDDFEKNVEKLEKLFPGVPSIGCIAMGYDKAVLEKGVAITAFIDGVTVAAGALENVSVSPARHIDRLIKDVAEIIPQ